MKSFNSDVPALFFLGPVEVGESIEIDPEEARHARALRLREGDSILLLDGAGRRSQGAIERVEKRRITVKVFNTVLEEPEKGLYIGLIIGILADKNRMEWLVEKSVELGVREILPLRSERTEGFYNKERLLRVACAALKQCQRSRLPEIRDEVDWGSVEPLLADYDAIALFHEQESTDESLANFQKSLAGNERVLILVGPEGGFSNQEVDRIRSYRNARILSLGRTRLRAETAAIVGLGTLQTMQG